MISFGQNFEDVVLERVLCDIEKGNYVDVGAHDSELDSVTNHFYKKGWSGINIEPQKHFFDILNKNRPRDINLNLCIGETNGEISFATVENRTGWSTSSQKQIENLGTEKDLKIKIDLIEQKTLTSVLNENELLEIHFLKVDVEGNEAQVIQGLDLTRFRPWVMVIEATLPGSTNANYEEWEPMVLEHGYLFAYTDGLNRFYLAKEHNELLSRFGYPPNVLDNFESQHTYFAKRERDLAMAERDHMAISLERLTLANDEARSQIENLNYVIASNDWEITSLQKELMAFRGSLSWKITKPLRTFASLVRFR